MRPFPAGYAGGSQRAVAEDTGQLAVLWTPQN
jgi:hypothetical protein